MYKFSGPKIICIISVVSVQPPPVLTDQTSGRWRQTGTGGDIILLSGNYLDMKIIVYYLGIDEYHLTLFNRAIIILHSSF